MTEPDSLIKLMHVMWRLRALQPDARIEIVTTVVEGRTLGGMRLSAGPYNTSLSNHAVKAMGGDAILHQAHHLLQEVMHDTPEPHPETPPWGWPSSSPNINDLPPLDPTPPNQSTSVQIPAAAWRDFCDAVSKVKLTASFPKNTSIIYALGKDKQAHWFTHEGANVVVQALLLSDAVDGEKLVGEALAAQKGTR